MKFPAPTLGKLFTAVAGIDETVGSPVARQSPPQKGKSFAAGIFSKGLESY